MEMIYPGEDYKRKQGQETVKNTYDSVTEFTTYFNQSHSDCRASTKDYLEEFNCLISPMNEGCFIMN